MNIDTEEERLAVIEEIRQLRNKLKSGKLNANEVNTIKARAIEIRKATIAFTEGLKRKKRLARHSHLKAVK